MRRGVAAEVSKLVTKKKRSTSGIQAEYKRNTSGTQQTISGSRGLLLPRTTPAAPTFAADLLLARIPRYNTRCADVARQLHPLAFELLPGFAIDLDGRQRPACGFAKAEAHLLRRVAPWGVEFGGDLIVATGEDDTGRAKVSRGPLDAAPLSGAQPLARDSLSDQQCVALLADEEVAQPTGDVGLI